MAAVLRWIQAWLLCGLLAWPLAGPAQSLQPLPQLSARVIDQTGTLDAGQRRALEDKLAAFERERGSQVVVLLLRTTAPEDIFSYTQRLGDAWKIGRKDVGDGVLLVVAKDDRQLRIATAKAVEGAIPDVIAGRIIEQVITPRFRQGDFAAGLDARIWSTPASSPAAQGRGIAAASGRGQGRRDRLDRAADLPGRRAAADLDRAAADSRTAARQPGRRRHGGRAGA